MYTDLRYAFVICHATGVLWKQRGFLTLSGQPIVHTELVSKLLTAVQLPSKIAIIHCRAHQRDNSEITKGNHFGDQAAKWSAIQPLPANPIAPALRVDTEIPYKDKLEEGEGEHWKEKLEAEFREGFWRVPDGKPISPSISYDLSIKSCIPKAIVELKQW